MTDFGDICVLIIEARFYEKIADELLEGAIAELEAAGASHEVISVPGALEIPPALALAVDAGLIPYGAPNFKFHGCVGLGCVIRGETTHYETVSDLSCRGLMQLAIEHHVPLGNGILTVENREQAHARSAGGRDSKGAGAAKACLDLVGLSQRFNTERLKAQPSNTQPSRGMS